LRLGQLISNGSDETWSDGILCSLPPYRTLQTRDPKPPKWEWASEGEVRDICSALRLQIEDLFPPISGSEFDVFPLSASLCRCLWGWNAVEVGLNRLSEGIHDAKPWWNAKERMLYVGLTEVRCFKRKAPNQTRVIEEFEKRGWPETIENPLSCQSAQNQTIQDLNKDIEPKLIVFRGDGKGGIRWEYNG